MRCAPCRFLLPILLLCVLACGDGTTASSDATLGAIDSNAASTQRDEISFASDVQLTGYLTTSAAAPAGSPGVLLIHQYQRDDEQWGDWPATLATQGYRVFAFNLRGHGDSDPYDGNLVAILSDPAAAPADVDAALAYLKDQGQADVDRIAIVGTSIGANLAVRSAINDSAKLYVSLSSRKSAVETLAGGTATDMSSLFFLASENDGGGVQASDAQTMFDDTADPRKIKIYTGSADHGISILNNQTDAAALVEAWLAENL